MAFVEVTTGAERFAAQLAPVEGLSTAELWATRGVRDERAGQPQQGAARGGLAPWQLARVGGHIERSLASRLTNSVLASLVRLSEDHFARAFKASIGCSPHAYVVTRRIERAKALMLGSDLPLSQIAVDAGFSDQSHLSRCFRDRVGAPPASWRMALLSDRPTG